MKASPRLIRRSFNRASPGYDRSAVVQGEIRSRLLERLDLVRLEPTVVLDLGAGTGHATQALRRRYPRARVIALDIAEHMLAQAQRRQSWWRRFDRLVGDANRLPLAGASADLAFSNLMLQWCGEPDRALAEIRRVLRPGGLLTFTTLGPDTLRELRLAWKQVDAHVHVNAFMDMHDLGDALVRTGFAEPVMDVERLTVTYGGLDALLKELKAGGSRVVAPGVKRGLTTRRLLRALHQTYPSSESGPTGEPGPIAATLEVVYGHAWIGQPKPTRETPREIAVPLDRLRRRP